MTTAPRTATTCETPPHRVILAVLGHTFPVPGTVTRRAGYHRRHLPAGGEAWTTAMTITSRTAREVQHVLCTVALSADPAVPPVVTVDS